MKRNIRSNLMALTVMAAAVLLSSPAAIASGCVGMNKMDGQGEQSRVGYIEKGSLDMPQGKGAHDMGQSFRPDLKYAQEVIGMRVIDPAGENIGQVRDLVVDTRGGYLTYAMVSGEDYLGTGADGYLVPFPALSF
ncbi:MAG: PRC-barrel domain-containing protein, partial [Candidatus Eisenbacteria bacterium]